jgi:hypothetical protein
MSCSRCVLSNDFGYFAASPKRRIHRCRDGGSYRPGSGSKSIGLEELGADSGALRGTIRSVAQIGFGSSGHDMRVMFDVTNPVEREHTITKRRDESQAGEIKALLR